MGSLQGGALATVIDIVSSIALVENGHHTSGVSISLAINYITPAPLGTIVKVCSTVDKFGARLGFTSSSVYAKAYDKEELIATAAHTKYLLDRSGPNSALKPRI
jgi:acyl-coenzyme A thioesterase 13